MSPEERKKADEEVDKRKKKKEIHGGLALLHELEEEDEEEALQRQLRKNKVKFTSGIEEDDDYRDTENYLNREDVKGKLTDWLQQPHVQKYIHIAFSKIIKEYKDENERPVYENRIVDMCTGNKQSLEVNFTHINESNSYLASWILQCPKLTIPTLNDIGFTLSCEIFPQYSNIHNEIYIRIKDLPILDNLRDLRFIHLDNLIRVRGVVTKRSTVYPQMKKAMFICKKCGDKKGPFFLNRDKFEIGSCLICQSNGPYEIDSVETVYHNFQRVTIQESPGTVPPGRIPRHKEVIVTNDLVDMVRPGDEVEVTGIYIARFDMSTNIKHSFPVFSTLIEANYIKRLNELDIGELTDEDKVNIRKLSKDPNIAYKIINSIAPSIYGHFNIKRALAMAMFGGVPKDISGKHKIRGDINVLLLGDPGVAKSQFLKYTNKLFHRSIYTTGKGASAVGLTAGVHKDSVTKEWVLEGGALVLADKGICLIDEFDKMNDQDRTSIHEAMEQQSISISKAGIVTSLQARCSVIAAANPIKGRYDNQLTFSDNVDLTDPILSRFDILCVVKDEVDPATDTALVIISLI
jgi:DNA replication licensing factor MCM2